jgi:uncharacterized membrane protein YsdA (DUF1294 family)
MSIYFYIVLAAVIVWNIITFSLYAIDKAKARKNQWRISEATLIICAFLMGGIGALLGMQILRHKTQHIKFKVLVPIAVVVNIAALVGCYLLLA